MKPVCVKCRRFYRMKKQGFYFEEGMPGPGATKREDQPSGTLDGWQSYKLWASDLWWCPGCGHEILSGFGREPISEHYKDDYASMCTGLAVTLRVDDC
jgi:hypothetical protein